MRGAARRASAQGGHPKRRRRRRGEPRRRPSPQQLSTPYRGNVWKRGKSFTHCAQIARVRLLQARRKAYGRPSRGAPGAAAGGAPGFRRAKEFLGSVRAGASSRVALQPGSPHLNGTPPAGLGTVFRWGTNAGSLIPTQFCGKITWHTCGSSGEGVTGTSCGDNLAFWHAGIRALFRRRALASDLSSGSPDRPGS